MPALKIPYENPIKTDICGKCVGFLRYKPIVLIRRYLEKNVLGGARMNR
jgi:hypothetical protein